MLKRKSIGINMVLNIIKSGLSILFPLITYPYITRILGANGVGKISYGDSIVNYFSLISMLGVSVYGVREGAKIKRNKVQFQKFINEIFSINIYSTVLSYVLLASFVFLAQKLHNYTSLIALQSLSILFTTFSMDWINVIYEDFRYITLRSIFAHILSIILMFFWIKEPEDYYKYVMLTVITNGCVCFLNLLHIRRYAQPRFIMKPDLLVHIKPLLLVFSNVVTISLYVNFDVIMLGWIKGDYAVGIYTIAVKIYTIAKNLMSAVYVVVLPRLASYVGEEKHTEYRDLYTSLWEGISILVIPSGVGLLCVAKDVMILVGGKKFEDSAKALQILSIALIFAIFGGLVTAVLNITIERERDNLIATVLSAGINCALNLVFIPLFSQNGAALTTLISEMFVLGYCLIRIPQKKKYINLKTIRRSMGHACIGSIMIFSYLFALKYLIRAYLIRMALGVLGSILIYVLILVILRNEYIMVCLKSIRKKIKSGEGHNG